MTIRRGVAGALVWLLPVAAAAGAATGPPALVAEFQRLLDEQAAAWTRGDLDTFCTDYLEDVTFVSPSGVTRGRAEVLERYRKKYPTKEAMGVLSLELLEARPAPLPRDAPDGGTPPPPDLVTVVARWRLEYPGTERPTVEGHTLLVFHRTGAGWRIAQDASM